MVLIQVFNQKYERLAFLSGVAEGGIRYFEDVLRTTIDTGVYTLEFKGLKDTQQIQSIQEGNYIWTETHTGKPLLLVIGRVFENGDQLEVYCEDTTVRTMNAYVEPIEEPTSPELLSYYVNHALENSVYEVKTDESTETLRLSFGSSQRILDRLRRIAEAFEVELDFDIDFIPGNAPKRYVSFLKKRAEGEPGFRLSTDNFLEEITRDVNIYNLATKLNVKGKQKEQTTTTATSGGSEVTQTNKKANAQPTAKSYDSSKSSGATRVTTSGWSLSEVNNFKLDQADPPYVDGQYIDTFLRNYYPDSPLIGQGNTIKELSDYFGVSVGAALGVWAKETTFGRAHPGKVDHNYGCIRHTSGWPAVWYGGSAWNKYPNKRTGIAAWFKLIRWSYLEPSGSFYSRNYKEMLDWYSPTSENNQSTFKNLMWGVLKSFGYDMSDRTLKNNYSKKSDDPRNIQTSTPNNTQPQPNTPQVNTVVEKAISWAEQVATRRLTYQWGGNGNPSYDCSGYVVGAYRAAGVTIPGRPTTQTMWSQQGPFRRVSRNELQRGDLIMYDTGYTWPGDANHVGLYLGPSLGASNSVIHAGNPVGIKQAANSMTIVGYIRVVY